MLKADKLPESWITVHRAMKGSFSRCLTVGLKATEDDPVTQGMGLGRGGRRQYLGYVLAHGFKNGRVILAQPRVGLCVVSRVGRSWSPLVLWNRIRLLATLTSTQRDRLKRIESAVEEHADPDTRWVRCLSLRRRFRGRGLRPRLLQQALRGRSDSPVLMLTARDELARAIEDRGGEHLQMVSLEEGSPTPLLYRLSPEILRHSVEATVEA